MNTQTQNELYTIEAYDQETAIAYLTAFGDLTFVRDQSVRFRAVLPQGRVIDIGCGPGHHSQLFPAPHYTYVGMDASPHMVALAQKRFPQETFLCRDIYDHTLPQSSFDGFWANLSLHHIPKGNIARVLSQIHTLIKKGGYGSIRMKEGSGEGMLPVLVGKDRFNALYNKDEFGSFLTRAGFLVVSEVVRDIRYETTGGVFLDYLVQS